MILPKNISVTNNHFIFVVPMDNIVQVFLMYITNIKSTHIYGKNPFSAPFPCHSLVNDIFLVSWDSIFLLLHYSSHEIT